MADALDIHPASHDEVLAAHLNVFEHWSRGRSLEEHMQYRLTSPSHSRATWFVGCVGGKVVVSLGSYPFQFQVRGEVIRGSAIGSVFTVPEFRRQGHAHRLVCWVDDYQTDAGVGLSVLYSDIKPEYYAECGYAHCPSHEGWRDAKAAKSNADAPPFALAEFRITDEFAEVATMYAEYHGAAAISIVRDDAYWQSLIKKFPDDRYFWLQEPDGGRAGYVRVQKVGTTGRITDYALANRNSQLAEEFYAVVATAATRWDIERIGGWLPASAAARNTFDVEPRAKEITMLKPLAYDSQLDDVVIGAVDYFCEIDHV